MKRPRPLSATLEALAPTVHIAGPTFVKPGEIKDLAHHEQPTAIMTRVFMLHDRDHSDFDAVRRIGNLGTNLRVRSFTDLIDEVNPHNAGLTDAAFFEADLLLIQQRLLNPVTHDVLTALNSSMLSSICQTEVGVFDDEYRLMMLSFGVTIGILEEAHGVPGSQR